MKIGFGIAGMFATCLLVVGCAGVTDDPDDADDEVVGEDTSELKKGGCSNAQIRQAQASCRSGGLCANGKSRGINFCRPLKQTGFEYQFSCACR